MLVRRGSGCRLDFGYPRLGVERPAKGREHQHPNGENQAASEEGTENAGDGDPHSDSPEKPGTEGAGAGEAEYPKEQQHVVEVEDELGDAKTR